MVIIQLSDFHLNDSSDYELAKLKIDKLFETVKSQLINEKIVFCICGDIYDKGNDLGNVPAFKILNYLRNKFKSFELSFEFVPGNHDLVNADFIEFDELIGVYTDSNKYSYSKENLVIRNYGDITLILINSVYHKDHEYGDIDIKTLEKEIRSIKNNIILVTHHTLMSRYDKDKSPIRNSYDLLNLIEEKKISAVLHGHTHGYSKIKVGENCHVIGVGPFLKYENDINNQFNLIKIIGGDIISIDNYGYLGDTKEFIFRKGFKKERLGYFKGNNLEELYGRIVNNIKTLGHIDNFHMHMNLSIEEFNNGVETLFKHIIPIAQKWQLKEVPEDLYYTHGMYMDKGNISGLDYIIKELSNKSTSNRAIIPLVNVLDVIESKDGFFPSLDIIQFGFASENKEELYVTLYLRALEVNHFLKINLSEVYLMTKYITNKILSVNKINLNIIAFRAQFKESFGCFQKAEIDLLEEREIMMLIMERDAAKIVDLLQNKLNLSETVIKDNGVVTLCNCLNTYYNRYGRESYFGFDIVDNSNILKEKYIELKHLREKTSIINTITEKENNVATQLEKLILLFNELKDTI